jgi:hypothetical protein
MEFIDDWDERGFSGNLVARALGPAQGIVYNAAAQQPQTTLSKTVPGVSWFKAGRNVLAGRPNDRDTGELEGTGRYGN